MKKLVSILLVLVMVLGVAAAETVKIGFYSSMTGDHAEHGLAHRAAAQLMVDQWNANGGAGGYTIELVDYDDKNSGEEAASIAEKMCLDDDIVAVVGGYASGVTMAATPIYQEYGLTNISACASHKDFTAEGEYIFRNNTTMRTEGAPTVEAVADVLGATKVGMLYIQTDWGVSSYPIIQELIEANEKLELVAVEETVDGSDDYSTIIAKFMAAECEAIICVAQHNTLVPFAKQYRALDPDIGLGAFAASYDQQVITLGGDAVEGLVFPVSFSVDTQDPVGMKFVEDFREFYGSDPTSLTAQVYDTVGIICTAIDQVGSKDRDAIRDAINAIDYQGACGRVTFDENGECNKTFMTMQIQDGKFVQIK